MGERKRYLGARESLLEMFLDGQWHDWEECKLYGGVRYSARILELKRIGWKFKDKPLGEGKAYKLVSSTLGVPRVKKVKVYLHPVDATMIAIAPDVPERARKHVQAALRTYEANESKL